MSEESPAQAATATLDAAASASGARPDGSADAHRDRLLEGLAASIRERTYAETTVADIVRHARTSRRTFYEHFPTKLACLMALLQQLNAQVMNAVASAVDPDEYPLERVRQAIHAWLQTAQSDPAITLCWIREVPMLGDEARSLERQFADGFVALIQQLTDSAELRAEGVQPASRERAIMLLGGLRQLIAATVEGGGDVGSIEGPAVDFTISVLGPPPQLPDAAEWRRRYGGAPSSR